MEYLTPSACLDEPIAGPVRLDAQGFLPSPARPGLGATPDRNALARSAVG